MDWYNQIAIRNGGYRTRAKFRVEGVSAEDIFEERLKQLLPQSRQVLDAGCGHGEFTLHMSSLAQRIIGFDFSPELIHIAKSLLQQSGIDNVVFVLATTKEKLPFEDGQFDLIYDRRGPASILNHSEILSPGGLMFGIHTSIDKVRERLKENGYVNTTIEEFQDAFIYIPDEHELKIFLSDVPGNPDFMLPQNQAAFDELKAQYKINEEFGFREHKYIWTAVKPG
nr:class I SAM-dependent methyltransferase [Paenibacillus lemnae]